MSSIHTLGIFEAGISRPGEMEKLERIIKPTYGIFTNIGSAHDEGFNDQQHKISEKLNLFRNCETLFLCADHTPVVDEAKTLGLPLYTWSVANKADVQIKILKRKNRKTKVSVKSIDQTFALDVPFRDDASLENIFHCVAVLVYFKVAIEEIQKRILLLQPVAMRLEMKEGINNCYLIDDTYNNDLAGINIALNFLDQQQQLAAKAVILSDVLESGMREEQLYQAIAALIVEKNIDRFVGIGPVISKYASQFPAKSVFFHSTEDFLAATSVFSNEIILIKGARVFRFEKIIQRLLYKVHGTQLEINLDALTHNLNFYRSLLKPGTKIMVMVKALAYGSGSFEVASLLQYHKVDYLAVAYVDEGVELRKNGINLPIMVMNPSDDSFEKLLSNQLEPEIYSFKILSALEGFLASYNGKAKIHLKIDTGMRRLGFEAKDMLKLCKVLKRNPNIEVASVFTHLAGADEALHNEFSATQLDTFEKIATKLDKNLGYKPTRHALNSAGIVRFPNSHMGMVRLGIGLYGIEATGQRQTELQNVGTLKTIISQIKEIKQGETVGYGRQGKASKNLRIATLAIGYADGYRRSLSNGKGKVLVNGKTCPIIGNVCMDMCMADVTAANASEGDEVIVFGKDLSVIEMAAEIGTIPYEILTSISERVKRVFFSE
jgi:alanine racemase